MWSFGVISSVVFCLFVPNSIGAGHENRAEAANSFMFSPEDLSLAFMQHPRSVRERQQEPLRFYFHHMLFQFDLRGFRNGFRHFWPSENVVRRGDHIGTDHKQSDHSIRDHKNRDERLDALLQLPLESISELARLQTAAASFALPQAQVFSEHEVLNLVQSNCRACHSKDSPIVELPLQDLSSLARYVSRSGEPLVHFLFGHRAPKMPPPVSPYRLSEAERNRLVATLLATQERPHTLAPPRKRIDRARPANKSAGRHDSDFAKFLREKRVRWQSFDDLIALWQSYLARGSLAARPTHLLVPFGRSLQRHFTDARSPREIVSLQISDFAPAQFVGYSPRAESLEIISWDQSTGRYVFQVAHPLRAGEPLVLTTPPRETCIACHQQEGPIFSRHPWAEVPFLNRALQNKMDSDAKSSRLTRLARTGNPFEFDSRVRKANQQLLARKFCAIACQNDKNCWQELTALGNLNANLPPNWDERLREFDEQWPKEGLRQISSVLPDRDPVLHPETGITTVLTIASLEDFKASLADVTAGAAPYTTTNFYHAFANESALRADGLLSFAEGASLLPVARYRGLKAQFLPDPLAGVAHPTHPRPHTRGLAAKEAFRLLRPFLWVCQGSSIEPP